MNNVDFFNLLEILLNKSKSLNETREKAINYAREHEVEKTVIMTVAGAVNCKIDYNALDRKGDVDMCTVFEEIRAKGTGISQDVRKTNSVKRAGSKIRK